MEKGNVIIFSAPSGCGKSTIIGRLMEMEDLDLQFSVSATNRPPRIGEVNGVNYHFMSTDEFRSAIDNDKFVEWEEVYEGRYYGTLKSEIDRITDSGHNVVLDIDVKGGVNVMNKMGDRAISIFIVPPSVEVLRRRLESRGTDPAEEIDRRVAKAEWELTFADKYDCRVVNDKLDDAVAEVHDIVKSFIN